MMRWIAIVLMGCGSVYADPPDASAPADVGDAAASPDAALDASVPPDTSARRWTLVQTRADESAELNVAPLGSQHLIIVAVHHLEFAGSATVADDSGCNSYVAIPATRVDCLAMEPLQIFYAKNSCAGATSISAEPASRVAAMAIWEVSGIRTDDPLGDADFFDDGSDSTTPRGPSITTSTEGEFIVSFAIVENEISGIRPGNAFTNDHTVLGDGWAHLTDATASPGTYQAQWDQPTSGSFCASAAAFKVGP